jgi:hypothetical protein
MAPMTAVATAVVARPPVFVEKKVDFRNSKQPWGVAVYVGDIPPHVPDEILGRCLECFGRTQVPVAHRCRCCFFFFDRLRNLFVASAALVACTGRLLEGKGSSPAHHTQRSSTSYPPITPVFLQSHFFFKDKEKEKEAALPNPAHRPFGLVLFENPVAAGRCLDLLRTSLSPPAPLRWA